MQNPHTFVFLKSTYSTNGKRCDLRLFATPDNPLNPIKSDFIERDKMNVRESLEVVILVTSDDLKRTIECIRRVSEIEPDVSVRLVASKFADKSILNWISVFPHKLVDPFDGCGWVGGIQSAFADTDKKYVVMLDSRVHVYDGWLSGLIDGVEDDNTAIVFPWTTKQIRPPQGFSNEDLARMLLVGEEENQEDVFPLRSCCLLNVDLVNSVGGWQAGVFGPGRGAMVDLFLRLREDGRRCILATNVIVDDHSNSQRLPKVGMDGYSVLANRWGWKRITKLANSLISPKETIKKLSVETDDSKKPLVVFVFRECVICGASLLVSHVCNELNRNGWRAFIACTQFVDEHQNVMPLGFSPMVFGNEYEMNRCLGDLLKGRDDSVVVAPLKLTVDYCLQIQEKATVGDKKPKVVYYVQDDESLFQYPSGEYYNPPGVVEESYHETPNVIANSDWVAKKIHDELKRDVEIITPGVDVYTFRRRNRVGRVRLMAHCRPSTPRRGWEFIAKVLNRVSADRYVEIVTYDEAPVDLYVPFHAHLGRVSPDELAREMGFASIFFEGSETQGFGMQALEAMSSECALVCTNNRGINTFGKHELNCMVVPYGDVETTVKTIIHLIDNPKLRTKLAKNARCIAESMTWEFVGQKWDAYLKGGLE